MMSEVVSEWRCPRCLHFSHRGLRDPAAGSHGRDLVHPKVLQGAFYNDEHPVGVLVPRKEVLPRQEAKVVHHPM